MVEEIYERLTALEVRVDEHGKKLAKQEDKNESQIEMNMLIKMSVETSKEHAKQMSKFSETLDRVNENLTNLNTTQQQMKSEMTQIGERVTDIEINQESKKIDLGQLAKNTILYIIPALLLAWLLIELGLK